MRPRSRFYDANGSIRQMGCHPGLQGSCSCRTPSIPRGLASRRLRFLSRVKSYVFGLTLPWLTQIFGVQMGNWISSSVCGAETASASEASPAGSLEAVDCWRQGWTRQGRAGVTGDMLCSASRVQTLFQMHGVGGGDGEDTPTASFPAPRVKSH